MLAIRGWKLEPLRRNPAARMRLPSEEDSKCTSNLARTRQASETREVDALTQKRNLPREWRLLRRAEYDAVYREGRRRSGTNFIIFTRRNSLPRNRFGMSVKKVLGNAVVRNRIRRRVREILRLHREGFAPGWDIVIHPARGVATLKFGRLEAELLSLLPRQKREVK